MSGSLCIITLPPHLRPHFRWWTVESNVLGGVSLTEVSLTSCLSLDTSAWLGCASRGPDGLGAVVRGTMHIAHKLSCVGGVHPSDITPYHISPSQPISSHWFAQPEDNSLSLLATADVPFLLSEIRQLHGRSHFLRKVYPITYCPIQMHKEKMQYKF